MLLGKTARALHQLLPSGAWAQAAGASLGLRTWRDLLWSSSWSQSSRVADGLQLQTQLLMAADERYMSNIATAHGGGVSVRWSPQSLRAQTSPALHHQHSYVSKRDRTDVGGERASRHGRQVSGKLQWGGRGGRKNQEVQEKDQMVREPEQDLHHSPLDRVCRLTHEPPV